MSATFELDAFVAPTNSNCTLKSYSIDETTSFGGLKLTSTCSPSKKSDCLAISYPLTTARLKSGSTGAFAYNLVVKYSSIDTAAYKAS